MTRSSAKAQTMGDRIVALLRQHDNMDQAELLRMLSEGDPALGRAPIQVDKSYLSRIINDKVGNPRRELVYAIADILHTDLEWLERGRVLEDRQYYTPRGVEAADLIEELEPDLQEWALATLRKIREFNTERRSWRRNSTDDRRAVAPRRIQSAATSILQKMGEVVIR